MRDYVPLNWVYLEDVELSAGTHRLRIEAARDDTYEYSQNYGIDCLLLTQAELEDYLQAHPEIGGDQP